MAEITEPAVDADGKSPEGNGSPQRRGFGTKRHAASAPSETRPELEEKLANLVDSVKLLQSHIAGGKPLADAATEVEPKPRGPKRFQRVGGDEAAAPEAEPSVEQEIRGDEATLNKNIAWPRITRPEEPAVSIGTRGAAYVRRHPFILWALVQATGLGLMLLGYWAGQSVSGGDEDRGNPQPSAAASKNASPDLLTRAGVNDRALQAVGIGLHAEKEGDLDAAKQVWEEATAGRVRVPGAEYRLAILEIERNDLTSADIHLTKSLAAGEMMASCYFVNACFAGKKSDYAGVAKELARAVRVEPFNAKYLFCWGEALRRAGKTQAGIDAITQALDRPASPSDLELFDFKRRLTRAESGHDEAFNAELADHLAKAPVGGDWLLLAAAQDLTRAAYPAAAAHLGDAQRTLSPHAFSLLVQDYLFQGYTNHPEIGPRLKVPPPPASARPMDPGAWPAEEADPAVWPPFSPAL